MNRLLKPGYAVLVVSVLLLSGLSTAQAAAVTYTFAITGDVTVGEESFGPGSNAFGLSAGNNISATGSFTADLGSIGSETGTVLFGNASGNSLTIDLNGTIITAGDDNNFGAGTGPSLAFSAGSLSDFDFLKTSTPEFNSSFTSFDNLSVGTLFGDWQTNANLTAVPLPAGLWLFGSGLIALAGGVRRRR